MIKFLEELGLKDLISNANVYQAEADESGKENYYFDGKDFQGTLSMDNNSISLQLCSRKECDGSDEDIDATETICNSIRKDFMAYADSLDDDTFIETCNHYDGENLISLNDLNKMIKSNNEDCYEGAIGFLDEAAHYHELKAMKLREQEENFLKKYRHFFY